MNFCLALAQSLDTVFTLSTLTLTRFLVSEKMLREEKDKEVLEDSSLEIEGILAEDVSSETFPAKKKFAETSAAPAAGDGVDLDTVAGDVHMTALAARNERLTSEIAALKKSHQQRLDEYEKLFNLRHTQSEAIFAAYKEGAQKKFDALKQLVSSTIKEKEDLSEQVHRLRKFAIADADVDRPTQGMAAKSNGQVATAATPRSPLLRTKRALKDGVKAEDSAAVEINSLKVYAEKLQGELTEARQKVKTLTVALDSEKASASRSRFELEAERHLRQEQEGRASKVISDLGEELKNAKQLLEDSEADRQKRLLEEKEGIIFVQHSAIQLYQLLTRLAVTHVEETKVQSSSAEDDMSDREQVAYQFNCLLSSASGVPFEYLLTVPADALLSHTDNDTCQFLPQSSFQTVPSSPTDAEDKSLQAEVIHARKQIPEYLQDEVEFQVLMLPKMFDKLSAWAAKY